MDGVIYAALLAFNIREDCIESAVVTISRGEEALRCSRVPPAAKRCDEGG